MIGVAELEHKKERWKFRKIIVRLKLTREGSEEIIAVGRIEVTPGFEISLHMKVIPGRKLPTIS